MAVRTSTTLSHSWLLAESCSTESVSKESSQRKMLLRQCDRFSVPLTTCIRITSCIEVFADDFYRKDRWLIDADLKPENLLYLTAAPDSALVLADFGIAKMLETDEVLTTMAGSFGYAAPEVMLKRGHGKPVDMWSLGVITYTLLCGYSPFRSESLADLIDECKSGRVVFHERYWKDVSKDAKDFINLLLQPDPHRRVTSSVSPS
jgi:serine/threonine protein kinase